MAAQERTILIVDDDSDARRFLAVLLEDHGYATVTAADGEEALAKMRQTRPDLITLDVAMPTRSGPQFYKSLRGMDRYGEIPVVLVTGVAAASQEILAARPGMRPPAGHVAKPVRPEDLLAVIEEALAAKGDALSAQIPS